MKQILATRFKKKNRTKAYSILLGIFGIISFVFGIVCLINPMKEESMPIMGGVLMAMGLVMALLIFIIIKAGKQIDKTNSYTEEAVVVEGETLYILTNKLIKIPLKEIKSVSAARDQTVGVFFRVIKSTGTLVIKTNTESHKLLQINNVLDAKRAIKSLIKK